MRTYEGSLDGRGIDVALVVSRFNAFVADRLLDGAIDCLERHGCTAEHRTIVRVPGAWEIPQATRRLAASGRYDAIVALGALVRGETPHFDLLAAEVTRGLGQVARDSGVPVAFGVLTTDTVEQAHRPRRRQGRATRAGTRRSRRSSWSSLFRRMDG